jgi:chitodextrinase
MGKYLEAAQKIRAVMDTAAGMLTDEQALKVIVLYPLWDAAKTYAVGDRVRYAGNLYRCLTAHTAQAAWTPTDAHSLWAKVLTDPSGAILPWVQPDSTNPYAKGDKVTHNGKTWESLVDNNVWEPGVTGTESLWKEVA